NCNFAWSLPVTNLGPFLQWDPLASVPPAGFIGVPATPHAIIGSPFGTNVFRIAGPNIGGPGVNVVETNLFNIVGKIFVRPATTTSLTGTPTSSVTGPAVTPTPTGSPPPCGPHALKRNVTFTDAPTPP